MLSKDCSDEEGFLGSWDSFNIVDVQMEGRVATYSLQSTVLIEMDISKSGINLTGFLKKQVWLFWFSEVRKKTVPVKGLWIRNLLKPFSYCWGNGRRSLNRHATALRSHLRRKNQRSDFHNALGKYRPSGAAQDGAGQLIEKDEVRLMMCY